MKPSPQRINNLHSQLHALAPGNVQPARLFSAPGRTELGGNHTDHNHGTVLAAAVNIDILAMVRPSGKRSITVSSQGYESFQIDLDSLVARPEERNSTRGLVRGLAAWFADKGVELNGFDIAIASQVQSGGGLSSSAAFEVLLACVMDALAPNGPRYSPLEYALAGQWAENRYFGKPCGLMDQLACAYGGILAIDFAQPQQPAIERISIDLDPFGHKLVLVDTGADHQDLSAQYAAIPAEMRSVAAHFGYEYLNQLSLPQLWKSIPQVRQKCGDRALLRALHFLAETQRPAKMANALRNGQFDDFLQIVRESGNSSHKLLQNLHVPAVQTHQAMDIALALSDLILGGRGASRVHGGGFGGAIQSWVPNDLVGEYQKRMSAALGHLPIQVLELRQQGVVEQ